MKCWGVILCEHYYLVCLLFKVSKFCSSGILQVPNYTVGQILILLLKDSSKFY